MVCGPPCRGQPPRDQSVDKRVDLQNRQTDERRRHVAADLHDAFAGRRPVVVETETEPAERRQMHGHLRQSRNNHADRQQVGLCNLVLRKPHALQSKPQSARRR